MNDITALAQRFRHWSEMAALTSERVSCLSVEQLEEIANVLESRTVTMPKLYGMDFCDRIVPDSRNGFLFYSEQVVDALVAAGIQVIEGEGQHGGNCE